MLDDMLTYAARHLTFFDAGLAVVVVLALLLQRPRRVRLWWGFTMLLMSMLAMMLSRIATVVYSDPRPPTVLHLSWMKPFLPLLPHLSNNSFPSAHAVLTGLIVASVLFLSVRWTAPFAIMGALDVWVRLGFQQHQVIDALGGWAVVSMAMLMAFPAGAVLTAVVLPTCQLIWKHRVISIRRWIAAR